MFIQTMHTKRLRLLSAVLAICMLLTIAPITAFASTGSGTCGDWGDNISWELDESGTLTLTGSGAMRDYSYSSGGGDDVSPWREFEMENDIKKIVVGDGITSIGSYAFYNCGEVTEVSLPAGFKKIGYAAFDSCGKLKNINLPDGLETIDDYAFSLCSALESIVIPDSVTDLGGSVFFNCYNLVSANIPAGITELKMHLFWGCLSLNSITAIPDQITKIGYGVFTKCSSLTEITLPAGLQEIEYDAFNNCSALTKITIDESNENYTTVDGVLYNKDKTILVSYPIGNERDSFTTPSTLTKIMSNSFAYSKNLKEVTLNEGLEEVPYAAFQNSKIISVNIPASVTRIGSFAFTDCYNLQTVNIAEGSKLESIGMYAFDSCKSLKQIELPEGLKTIDTRVFQNCTILSKVHIPSSVTNVGEKAFYNSAVLGNTIAINGIKYLDGWLVWSKTGITEAEVDDGAKGIADGGLADHTTLTTVNIPKSVIYINQDAFDNTPALASINVDEQNTAYSSLDGILYNKDKTSLVKYGEGRTETAFSVPDGVQSIEAKAISNVFALESVTLPQSLKDIKDSAFSTNVKLTSVNFSEGLETIDFSAFRHCTALSSFSLPDTLTDIDSWAFEDTAYYNDESNWENNTLKNNGWLLAVGDISGFSYKIDDDVKGIASLAFYDCSAQDLKSLTLPAGLRYISSEGLGGIYNVTDIYFPDSKEVWDSQVKVGEDNYILEKATMHFINRIHTVEINGATLSFDAGDAPVFTGSVPDGAPYYIDCERWNSADEGWTSSDFWNQRYGDFEGSWGMPLTEFKADTEYYYGLYIKANEDYIFADDAVLKINGNEIALSEENRAELNNSDTAWLSGLLSFTPSSNLIYGDVDGDGSVTITDATIIQKASIGLVDLTDNQIKCADVTGDGRVSISDVTLIQKYIAGTYSNTGVVGQKVK